MATVTFYCSDEQKASLESKAASRGQNVSEYLRELAGLEEERIPERVEKLERRVRALEELADRS